jgi:hypothetical protein
LTVLFTPADATNYATTIAIVAITVKTATPAISWNPPADIVYGTALGAAQLNATANVPGTFEYTPPAGIVLNAGAALPLAVTFTPADAVNYAAATASVLIDVRMAAPDAPGTPTPTSGAADVELSATLIWSDSAGATSYDVNWGTTDPPPAAIMGLTTTSWTPTLIAGTTYYWQVVARNAGGTSAGPIWSFTTASDPVPAFDVLVMDSFSGAAGPLEADAPTPTLQDGMVGMTESGSVAMQATLDAATSSYDNFVMSPASPHRISGPGPGGRRPRAAHRGRRMPRRDDVNQKKPQR